MICSICGQLVSVLESTVVVRPEGGLSYELHIPAYSVDILRARVGEQVRLETRSYIESQAQGAVLIPRLVGFLGPDEKAFFELFTTVKGLGTRKALRAMAIPPAQIATAIAERDHRALQELPEIGKRLAETIIVDLAEKITRFTWVPPVSGEPKPARRPAAAVEAAAALVALGQSTGDADKLVERALSSARESGRELGTADAIITAALRAR